MLARLKSIELEELGDWVAIIIALPFLLVWGAAMLIPAVLIQVLSIPGRLLAALMGLLEGDEI